MNPGGITVALVEPQLLIREALGLLLGADQGVTVVAEAPTPAELLVALRGRRVQVVLMSVEPGGEDPLGPLGDLAALLSEHGRTLVLTGDPDPGLHLQLIELGAMGVFMKDQTSDVLAKAIRKVHAGELWLDRTRTASVITRLTGGRRDEHVESAKVQSLTAREREVVALVADGMTNKQIAERLFISEATARNHLTSILAKLDLPDRFQLAVYAFRRGLVLCPQTSAMLRMSATMKGRPARRHDRPLVADHKA
jgi:two-component system nitrate/nitrite response regulator NarL